MLRTGGTTPFGAGRCDQLESNQIVVLRNIVEMVRLIMKEVASSFFHRNGRQGYAMVAKKSS